MPSKYSVIKGRKGKKSSEETDACEVIPISQVSPSGRSGKVRLRTELNLCECRILWKLFKGLFYIFLGCLCYATLNVIVKKGETIDPGEFSMIRHVGICCGALPVVIFKGRSTSGTKGKRNLVLLRAIVGALSLHLALLACRILPLAEAVIIMSTAPTVTVVLARILLKEACGMIHGFVLVITSLGVVLSTRVPAIIAEEGFSSTLDTNHLLGLAAAIGFVLSTSVTVVLQRALKDVHCYVIMMTLGIVGVIQNAGFTAAFGSLSLPRCGVHRLFMIAAATLGFSGQYFFLVAMNREAAAVFMLMKSCLDILIAIIAQTVFFTTHPDAYTISGGVLVLFSIGIISLKKI